MGNRSKNVAPTQYVIGRKSFAAITAVEGLKLTSTSADRLRRTESMSPSDRRKETIRAFSALSDR